MGKNRYMAQMIRCIWERGTIHFLPVKMLTGPNLKAVEKRRGASIQIADPELHTKLTREELKALSVNFPEYDPDMVLPPEPEPLSVEELGDLAVEPVEAVEEEEQISPMPKKRGRKPKTEVDEQN
jgi:hypothetical protein